MTMAVGQTKGTTWSATSAAGMSRIAALQNRTEISHTTSGATQTKGNNLALFFRDPFPAFTNEVSSVGPVLHKLKADP